MKHIVILGGGYGGLRIAKRLLSNDLPADTKITLIDRTPYHSFKTEFYALAAGTSADKQIRVPFPEDERLETVFGEIIGINLEEQTVEVRDRQEKVSYDYLVIGLGCEDNYHGVEGAKEYTHSIQTIKKTRATSQALSNVDAYGKVIIVGGGLSGVEIASELRESRPDINITLLERGDALLKPFDVKIQQYVTRWFLENDIQVMYKSVVDNVEKDYVCNNGVCLLSDVTIWTAGVRPNYLVRTLPVEKDKHERVIINDYYQIPTHTNVYVVGDCASLPHSPSAQLAEHQGDQLAQILLNVVHGKEPIKAGAIHLNGTLGSLGKNDGFGSIYNKPFVGRLPRLAKTGVLWLHSRH